MAKKGLICGLAIIILSLCCGICFAEEGNDTVNLGNEIMQSMNKTGDSVKNVISGNVIDDSKNMVKDGVDNAKNTAEDIGNKMQTGMNNVNKDMTGNYNATRTVSETTATAENGFATMTTTTWMWIILVVAAIVIIAAIWYYATQNNS